MNKVEEMREAYRHLASLEEANRIELSSDVIVRGTGSGVIIKSDDKIIFIPVEDIFPLMTFLITMVKDPAGLVET
jgi:hypothetical protein